MNLIRKYKLRELGIEPDSISKKLFYYIEDNLLNLEIIKFKDYVFFIKNDKIFFDLTIMNGNTHVIFHIYESLFYLSNLSFSEMESILLFILSKHYKINFRRIFSITYSNDTTHAVCIDRINPYR